MPSLFRLIKRGGATNPTTQDEGFPLPCFVQHKHFSAVDLCTGVHATQKSHNSQKIYLSDKSQNLRISCAGEKQALHQNCLRPMYVDQPPPRAAVDPAAPSHLTPFYRYPRRSLLLVSEVDV